MPLVLPYQDMRISKLVLRKKKRQGMIRYHLIIRYDLKLFQKSDYDLYSREKIKYIYNINQR